MYPELHFETDYAHSSKGLSELTRLIKDTFDVDVSPLDRLGHDPSVLAFGWWHGDDLVANISLYERHLWLQGKPTKAYGVQSVAVRPEWRGRGLFRDLMTKALEYADARLDLVILSTGTPDLYRRFGFSSVDEFSFGGTLAVRSIEPHFRRLSLEDTADVALLRDAFIRRAPTSLIACACDHPALFMLKAVATPSVELLHLAKLDAIVALDKSDESRLTLLDVVAPTIPSLEEIAAALGYGGTQVRVLLTPDRLGWVPESHSPIDTGYMVRGPYLPVDQPFMMSDMRI